MGQPGETIWGRMWVRLRLGNSLLWALVVHALALVFLSRLDPAPRRRVLGGGDPISVLLLDPVRVEDSVDDPPTRVGHLIGGLPEAEGAIARDDSPDVALARKSGMSEVNSAEAPESGGDGAAESPAAAGSEPRPGLSLRLDPGPPAATTEEESNPLVLRPPPFRREGRGPSDSRLESSGGGRHRIDGGPFVAHVDRDGTVEFEDKRNLHVELPTLKGLGKLVEAWQRDPYGASRGRMMEAPPGGVPTAKVLGGGFDLTDAVMRTAGQDPYAVLKLRALDETRDERAGIALAHRREDLRDSIAMLKRDLRRIARRSDLTLTDKRELFFQLWDECAEEGAEDIVAAAEMARATIIAFVCARFEPGSEHGYSVDELSRLNARRTSRRRFEPCR